MSAEVIDPERHEQKGSLVHSRDNEEHVWHSGHPVGAPLGILYSHEWKHTTSPAREVYL